MAMSGFARCQLSVLLGAICFFACSVNVRAASVGVISPGLEGKKRGPEAAAVLALELTPHKTTVLTCAGKGRFSVKQGDKSRDVALADFDVVWLHEGDQTSFATAISDKETIAALKKYVADGGGLLLTGVALSLVHDLGVEPARPRIGPSGNDSGTAPLRPLVKGHPIFSGIADSGATVMITDSGHPAFSDFHGTNGPGGGMLLAQTGGSENALVEYELGKGRILVMGWRLPHYSNTKNKHRGNLLRLTQNMLGYLGEQKTWQKVVVRKATNLRDGQRITASSDRSGSAKSGWRAMSILSREESLEKAIRDLVATFGSRYPKGEEFLKRLAMIEDVEDTAARDEAFQTLKREALLANPHLDFDRLLFIRRKANNLALPTNWQSYSSVRTTGHDNQIMTLSPVTLDGKVQTLFTPEASRCVTDVDLHFDAGNLLFSMPDEKNVWQIHELDLVKCASGVAAANVRLLPTIAQPDVHNYDACYLPDGGVIFTSTAPFVGVPCVRGSSKVTNLYLRKPDGTVRQLTVDQEHNWCPTVMNNGRVMYQRWEYTDTPHAFYRLMFAMNPDGTEQRSLYGTNSYWPNAMFYSRPVPNHSTRFVSIVGGHHDRPRMGELVIFDPSQGQREADGVVQRIPGFGQEVEPIILDGLTRNRCPRFLHPYPLSDKYFLVSCQRASNAPWGIYLVDVFDNYLLLREESGYALMEPVPLRATRTPPRIPDRVDPTRKDATVLMTNVYVGDGLKGVSVGTVKKLRVISYNFSYHGMGGQVDRVGFDGPWDVRQIIGTVPVEKDGSAHFRVPAYTPIAVQPLDDEGKALQMMRSWFTCMPGESLSCIGCHENANQTPPPRRDIASQRAPSDIAPWYGPPRGFSFEREVQPVLDRFCVGCHDGKQQHKGKPIFDLRHGDDVHLTAAAGSYNSGAHFSPSYVQLKRWVRGTSMEGDAHMLVPCDVHADSTKLVQLLQKGHYGVKLDTEAWDRLITWIDLNTPAHGTWIEVVGNKRADHQHQRRKAMRQLYTGIDDDPETAGDYEPGSVEPILPAPPKPPAPMARTGIEPDTARILQIHAARRFGVPSNDAEADKPMEPVQTLDLGEGVTLRLRLIPVGEFVLGDAAGCPDEWPPQKVRVERPFWIGETEVTNEQFARFNPKHDSRLEHGEFLQFSVKERGWSLSGAKQPVVRVRWRDATAFCKWLSKLSGKKVTLPSELQWEWAARAGSTTPLWYGSEDADFSSMANLADATHHSVEKLGWGLPIGAIPAWRPSDDRYNDGARVSSPVASYAPNAWGLFDVAGNAAEWTSSHYRPYSSTVIVAEADPTDRTRRVARGGSWQDRPKRARSGFRLPYRPDQPVIDVGFRVMVEAEEGNSE
jgi:formylglycine-generating enzyme required for sulfatase activity